jgi:hypothetical protein
MSDTTGSTPEQIALDIQLANKVITPWIAAFNPAIGGALNMALSLLAIAEPAIYKSLAAAISGQDLTPDQEAEKNAAEGRMQNPGQYFAD